MVGDNVRQYEYRGQPYTIKQLSEKSGIAEATIRDRLRRGYSVEQAVRPVATNDSVEAFCEASSWEDWIGMPINDLHTIYFKWCISKEYKPMTKQGFSRHLFSLNPQLKTIPLKRVGKCYRIIRKKEF